jgi:chorismate synthase
MKPIPTLKKPLPSLNLDTGEPIMAHKERSDVCAVPSASIVGEAMLAIALGNAFLDKYGGDSMKQIRRQYDVDPITHQE